MACREGFESFAIEAGQPALTPGRAVVKFEKGKALDRNLTPIQPVKKRKAVIQVGSESGSAEPPAREDERQRPDRDDPPRRG